MAFPVLPPFTTTPNRNNPATFSADTDQYHLELTPFVPLLNTWATEANTLGQDTQNARDIAVNAKDIALSTVNYKGDYVSGTYNLNESVTYTDGFNYVSKINGNTDIPTTSNWYRVPNIDDSVTTNYQMWSSSKIDTELTTIENNLTTEINKKVNIDGNQTINNIKTFNDSPIVPTPTEGDNSTKVATTEFINTKIDFDAVTGVATATNLDNNMQMTGVGLLKGLETGDVIKVQGYNRPENNGFFTVDDIVDANNIIVNQEHSGKSRTVSPIGTKCLLNEGATPNVTIEIFSKWFTASDTLGRGWTDTTLQRSAGLPYTNNTKRAFSIFFEVKATSGNGYIYDLILSGSTFRDTSTLPNNSNYGSDCTVTIESEKNYQINVTNCTLVKVHEFR